MSRSVCWVLLSSWAAPVRAAAPASATDAAEDKAVAFVQNLGGQVIRSDKLPGKPVVRVDLSGTTVTEADLKELAARKNLTTLSLSPTPLTDRTLAVLRELDLLHALAQARATKGKRPTKPEDVVALGLNGAPVTDARVKELAVLKNLNTLSLFDTKVTDDGVRKLQTSLPKCTIIK